MTWSIAESVTLAWKDEVSLLPVDTGGTLIPTDDGQGAFPPTHIVVADLTTYGLSAGDRGDFNYVATIKDFLDATATPLYKTLNVYVSITMAPSCPSAPYTVSINEASTLSSSSPYYVMIGSSVDLNGSSPLSVTVLDSDGVFPVTDSSCYSLAWSKAGGSG